MVNTLKLMTEVFKLRIGAAITLCTIAGAAITPGARLSSWKLSVLVFAVFLSSASAGAFNQIAERDLDARMSCTRNRPFVTGEFRASGHWLVGIGLILAVSVGSAAWVLNAHVALYVFLGAFVYGIVYTVWLKQRSIWNIVIGGLAGSFAVLAGTAAISPDLASAPIILAIVLFLWTPLFCGACRPKANPSVRQRSLPALNFRSHRDLTEFFNSLLEQRNHHANQKAEN